MNNSSTDNWGLTEKGFNRPTYTTLLNALEYKARELYGDSINLTVRSPLGLFLRIIAWIWNILWACLEDVYNSRFVDTAAGNSLYGLGRNIGMQLLPEGKATGYITITGTTGVKVPAGFLVATNSGLQYTVTSAVTIGSKGTALAIIKAVKTGTEYNTGAKTVQVIVNPSSVNGVAAVNNKSEITGGREKETDNEFRDRYYESVDYAGGVNADAIRASLLNDVTGVLSAYVYENDQDEYDITYKLPAHSMEAVVYGGLDEEVAKAIYARRAAGIQTVGSTEVSVLTASGQTLGIRFSRPTAKRIWIKISNLVTSSGYSGESAIKQALVDYIGDSTSGGLEIGVNVVYIKLPGVIDSIPGVEDFDLVISSDGVN
ncbi:MAG: baseplate J/gp47 family protein, partial [Lacrimispora sphenoides]